MAGDERLVEQIRRGNEAAFEVVFERHGAAILSYCRHMLGSLDEAEDAVQQAFASAYNDLLRDERPIKLKPWLFTIARNRCLSMLRARREQPEADREVATAGLSEQVERRAELRELLHDLGDLPEEQRAALVLAEVADLSHPEVAQVLGCKVARVKALVFRARTGLIERREARDTPCAEIREQLANLRGGALRRSELRHHLRDCPGCRHYREQVRRQRQMLAAVLPVTPSLGLKSAVLGSVGFGGASAGGGGALAGGLGAAVSGGVGSTVAKVAVVGALVGGGAVGGEQVLNGSAPESAGRTAPAREVAPEDTTKAAPGESAPGRAGKGFGDGRARDHGRPGAKTKHGKRGKGRRRALGFRPAEPPAGSGGRALGHEKQSSTGKSKPATGPRAEPKAGKGSPQGTGGGSTKPPAAARPAPKVKAPVTTPRSRVPASPPARQVRPREKQVPLGD
jgi:RNA polymerase sigma factor (sigma-70 family)